MLDDEELYALDKALDKSITRSMRQDSCSPDTLRRLELLHHCLQANLDYCSKAITQLKAALYS